MHMPKYTPTRLGTGCLPEEGKSLPPSFVPCRADTKSSPYCSGAGNMHHRAYDSHSHSPAQDERGRDSNKGGVLGNVLRSFSRAAGRDKSSEGRAKD